LLETVLRQKLTASSRFEIVDIPPDTIKEIASGPTISNCNDCQRRFAQMVGANWAAWGTVQKVSNLILNINVTGFVGVAANVDAPGELHLTGFRILHVRAAVRARVGYQAGERSGFAQQIIAQQIIEPPSPATGRGR
jgi:glycerate-2-kinase